MAKHRAALSAGLASTSHPHPRASTLLTVDQVAERLNVAPSYVRRRLIFEKRIAYVKIGRHVRIESKVVDGLIEAGRIEAEAVAPASGRRHLSIAEIRDEEVSRWRTSASTR
jgi:excisionase family DNA binding protein